MFGSRVGFSGTADRTAPFPVGSNSRFKIQDLKMSNSQISETHYPSHFMYVLYTDPTLHSDCNSIMTVDTYNGDSKLISQGRVTSRPTV